MTPAAIHESERSVPPRYRWLRRIAFGTLADLIALPVEGYDHTVLLDRVWDLRGSLAAYAAVYAARAEALSATLLRRDVRIRRAHGYRAAIVVV